MKQFNWMQRWREFLSKLSNTKFGAMRLPTWVWMGVAIASLLFAPPAMAFCGFYVAKADASLYNQASQVAIARDGDRTVLTMANDFQGDVSDFAMVVPVPVVLNEEQVKVAEPAILERLDAFSAPRLVEYFDENPCNIRPLESVETSRPESADSVAQSNRRQALGVTVESRFSVGEYDIVILSATESNGLETWLRENGYQLPSGASSLLRPYIRQGLKFFVAKVNLEEFDSGGLQQLRPLQMSYESPRFMLPIRLGMMNADVEQDLIVYLLSPTGRAELTNYRTVNIPSNVDIPVFVKDEFNEFYPAMFDRSYEKEGRNVAFLEYAWDMGKCDPCSADPLSPEELRQAGVTWLDSAGRRPGRNRTVFITRLHVRYTRDKFPEDLIFQSTGNRQQFQGRYVMRHPYLGPATCPVGADYKRNLPTRFEQEAQTLARLTGWSIHDIRPKLPTVELEASEERGDRLPVIGW